MRQGGVVERPVHLGDPLDGAAQRRHQAGGQRPQRPVGGNSVADPGQRRLVGPDVDDDRDDREQRQQCQQRQQKIARVPPLLPGLVVRADGCPLLHQTGETLHVGVVRGERHQGAAGRRGRRLHGRAIEGRCGRTARGWDHVRPRRHGKDLHRCNAFGAPFAQGIQLVRGHGVGKENDGAREACGLQA